MLLLPMLRWRCQLKIQGRLQQQVAIQQQQLVAIRQQQLIAIQQQQLIAIRRQQQERLQHDQGKQQNQQCLATLHRARLKTRHAPRHVTGSTRRRRCRRPGVCVS